MVLQLVKEGVLSLDAPIGPWLPEYPEWKDKTLRHLLTMTSGIPTYDDTEAFLKALAAGLGITITSARPTDQLRRSRPGRLAAADQGLQLLQHQFHPCTDDRGARDGPDLRGPCSPPHSHGHGLTDTFYAASIYPDAVTSRMVSGYLAALAPEQKMLEPLCGRDSGHLDMSWAQAAGGAVATPSDVTRWARLLFTGTSSTRPSARTWAPSCR